MTAYRAGLGGVMLPLLALGACAGAGPSPGATGPTRPAVSSSTPSTAAPAPAVAGAPTMPAAARGTDAASAEAFVRFYWEMVDYAQRTGDVSGLEALATRSCAACRARVSFLRRVFRAHGTIEGGRVTASIRESGFIGDHHSDAVVVFDVRTTPQRVRYPGSRPDKSYPGGVTRLSAVLVPARRGWLMASWGRD